MMLGYLNIINSITMFKQYVQEFKKQKNPPKNN